MHDKAVKFVRDLDLAGKPRVRAAFPCKIQHVLFHDLGSANRLGPRFIDVNVAGGAGAGTAAFGLNAGDRILDRVFHDGGAVGRFYDTAYAIMRDIGDFGQGEISGNGCEGTGGRFILP